MTKYVLTFHGEMTAMPEDPKEMEAAMAKWGAWYATMGEALVDPGAPFGPATAIGPNGALDVPASMTGYTIIDAADAAAATAIAEACPVLDHGHTVQISEAIDMS